MLEKAHFKTSTNTHLHLILEETTLGKVESVFEELAQKEKFHLLKLEGKRFYVWEAVKNYVATSYAFPNHYGVRYAGLGWNGFNDWIGDLSWFVEEDIKGFLFFWRDPVIMLRGETINFVAFLEILVTSTHILNQEIRPFHIVMGPLDGSSLQFLQSLRLFEFVCNECTYGAS